MPNLQGFTATFPGGTSQFWTTPYPAALGVRARDSSGNEFVFCEVVTGVYPGCLVQLDDETWRAKAISTSGKGKVGVAMPPLDTSAPTDGRGIWVQVYGRVLMQVGGSVVSPSDAANGPTTGQTSTANMFCLPTSQTSPSGVPYYVTDASSGGNIRIVGIMVATGASPGDVSGVLGAGGSQNGSAATSAGNFIGSSIYVFLNYPEILPHLGDIGTPT